MTAKAPSITFENQLLSQGYRCIVGIDEVGRGAWAGPLVAAACVLKTQRTVLIPKESGTVLESETFQRIYRVRDSKILTSQLRTKLAWVIKKKVLSWSVAEVSVKELANLGLTKALELAYERALDRLAIKPTIAIIDGQAQSYRLSCPYQSIVKGDSRCLSIACASILAKEYRDRLMRQLAKEYRSYGFERHKGYGTKYHQQQLAKYGPSDIHRKNFKSIKFYTTNPAFWRGLWCHTNS